MEVFNYLFWFFLAVVVYTFIGYGLVLYALVLIKRVFKRKVELSKTELPNVTLFITAYNEKDYVDAKLKNSFALDYPPDKLTILWVTDGSDDGTPDIIRQIGGDRVRVEHVPERGGKIGAMNRGMRLVETSIVVFCDANTMLGRDSIRRIVELFGDPRVGCVSGEKRVVPVGQETAVAAEGLYWKYESKLKQWDAELNSVVGAAGELFAIRKELFEEVERDTILDDFIISLRIAMRGYKIQYNPEAYAMEHPSSNLAEELKRKVRISAGGIQSIIRLYPLLYFWRYKLLSFQYISHRVLRWTIAPLGLPLILLLNICIVLANYSTGGFDIYFGFLIIQILFYLGALLGFFFEKKNIRIAPLYVPYYFLFMNYAVYLGFIRFFKGKQSVNWERSKRAK